MKIHSFWGQKALDLGDRWRTNIMRLHIQKGKSPSFSLNGKLLREADKAHVMVEVTFPTRYGYILAKTPKDWLRGRRELRASQFEDSDAMDFYYHEVPLNFPRDGRKKELYQAVGQIGLLK